MQDKLWTPKYIAMLGSTLFMACAFCALLPTLPIYLLDVLKVGHRSAGLVIAAFSITAILIRPISGYLLDNYHRSRVLILALCLMTLTYGVYPLLGGVAAILLLRLIHGALWGVCTSSSATVVADIVPPARLGHGIGIYALTIPIGMTIGPMFGIELMRGPGPLTMFVAIGAVSFLSLLGAFYARIPFKPAARRRFTVANLFHGKAIPLSSSMFFVMIAYGAVIVFAGVYATEKGFTNVAAFFLCFSATTFLSRLFAGRCFDRGHIVPMISMGLLFAAAGMAWLGFAWSPAQFLLAGMMCGLGFGILMPTCQAAINSLVPPGERGSANSTYFISYDLGVGVGAFIIGLFSDKTSLAQIYRYTVILLACSAVLFALSGIPHYRRNRGHGAPERP